MVTALTNTTRINFNGTSAQRNLFDHTVEVLLSIHSLHRTNAIAKQLNSNLNLDAVSSIRLLSTCWTAERFQISSCRIISKPSKLWKNSTVR